jgi:hypothetical protein
MDHRTGSETQSTAVKTNEKFDAYVTENGEKFRVPYHMIKKVTFTNVSKQEMIDIPHAARLQYRLMLLDPIMKASVDFTKAKIIVTYNPDTADNNKEKMSLDELRAVLKKEGISTHDEHMVNEDYDYYKNFYSYAYNPPSIRERAPYGYTAEQWQALKPEWQEKLKKGNLEKVAKHRAFQQAYLEENPEMAAKLDPNFKPTEHKQTFTDKLLGRKKKGNTGGGKGFWFHGI